VIAVTRHRFLFFLSSPFFVPTAMEDLVFLVLAFQFDNSFFMCHVMRFRCSPPYI